MALLLGAGKGLGLSLLEARALLRSGGPRLINRVLSEGWPRSNGMNKRLGLPHYSERECLRRVRQRRGVSSDREWMRVQAEDRAAFR